MTALVSVPTKPRPRTASGDLPVHRFLELSTAQTHDRAPGVWGGAAKRQLVRSR